MFYRHSQHAYPDCDLVSGNKIKDIIGVTAPAISKAKLNGRIDTFENSEGKECFHREITPKQFFNKRDRRHITTPTRAQMASGFDNMTAQAVAHRREFDVGLGTPPPSVGDGDPFDLGEALAERADLATSKAQKEFYQAKLMKLKSDEMEGRLVPKQQAAIAAYQLGANIQDKIMTVYARLAPEVVGYFKEAMTNAGVDNEKITAVTAGADHAVGEKIRKTCLAALRDLTEKTEENILDG